MSTNGSIEGRPLQGTVTLKVPVNHGGEMLYEVEVLEPTVEGLMTLDTAKGEWDGIIKNVMACTGLPPSVVKQLRARDIKAILEAINTLNGEIIPPTGETEPPGLPSPSTGRQGKSRSSA